MNTTPQFTTLRAKIAAETKMRRERDAQFEASFARAAHAGFIAGQEALPTPMMVVQPSATNPNVPSAMWHVEGGCCGFAWVKVTPGNSAFAKWLVKQGHARKAYSGGVDIWISDHGQSMERKEEHARAMAKVLSDELGVKCYADSRMD